MSPEELLKHQIEYTLNVDRLFRSQIIYEVISLEAEVETIVASYFCGDVAKHPLFFELVFGEITFSQKTKILRKILKLAFPELLETFKPLLNGMDTVRTLRNRFAHQQSVLPVAPHSGELPESIKLRSYRDGQVVEEEVTRSAVDAAVSDCRTLHFCAYILKTLVGHRVDHGEPHAEEESYVSLAKNLLATIKHG
jgi:hypothetical protein